MVHRFPLADIKDKISVNQPIDLTLLNNRIIQTEQGKAIVPRIFNYISSGNISTLYLMIMGIFGLGVIILVDNVETLILLI